jgi:hypothetical protein
MDNAVDEVNILQPNRAGIVFNVSVPNNYVPHVFTVEDDSVQAALDHEKGKVAAFCFAHSPGERRKVEALFAELKNQIGLRRLRLRRMKFVREQFFLAAATQNIKRLVRFLSYGPQPPLPAAT